MQLLLTGLCVSFISILTVLSETSNESVEMKKYDDMCEMSAAVNGFGFDMQKKVSENNSNMVFSPFSIYGALGMLSLGARKNTKEEIITALKWHNSKSKGKLTALRKLFAQLVYDNLSDDVKIEVANGGWVANDVNVLDGFQKQMKKYFNATLRIEDFETNPAAARENINNWVSQKTHDLINDLFPASAITADTKLALANAIYFKGTWKMPFDTDDSRVKLFYNSDGTSVNVTFMKQRNVFKEAYYRNVQFLELPYLKETFSMLIAMPMLNNNPANDDFTDVNALIKGMDSTLFKESMSRLEEMEVELQVPKFKIKQGFKLKSHLQSLGINDVFDTREANLSGINGRMEFCVSSAMHKAFIQVDERGTKMGAGSGVGIMSRSMAPTVKINRPFLFFILNKKCDSIIMAGKIVNPLK